MQNITKLLGGTALAVVGATAASAGGMEAGRYNPAFMFESGNYAEISIAQTTPNVKDDVYSPDGSMLSKMTNFTGSMKLNINDRMSVGITTFDSAKIALSYEGNGGPFTSTPIPAALDAQLANAVSAVDPTNPTDAEKLAIAGLPPAIVRQVAGGVVTAGFVLPEPYVDLSFRSTILTLNYKISDRLDVFGGIKYSEGSATGNVISEPSGDLTAKKSSSTAPVVGVSYSIPNIALRVTATYQGKATTKHETSTAYNATMQGLDLPASMALNNTEASLPESFTVDFQTGIAANTLLFGSIHHAKWGDAHIYFDGSSTAKSTWEDSTTYSLGVGRKLNDNWAVSGSVNYEAAGDKAGTSLLATTNGVQGLSVGAKYTQGNMNISGGVNYSMLGDKDVTSFAGKGSFKDNSAITMGMKVGFNF